MISIVFTLVACASILFGVKLAGRVFGVAGSVVYALLLLSPLLATWVFHDHDLSNILALVSFVALLVINGRANRALKAAGIRVGLIGANPRDVP